MTDKLTKVEGSNTFCGPAVIASVAGITTDEAEKMIQHNRCNYKPVKSAYSSELVKVMRQLGWKTQTVLAKPQSLYSFISEMKDDGYYLITVPHHFIVVYKEGNQRFFCDNHTKEPIRAASSARLMQKVLSATRVWKYEEDK